MIAIPNMEKPKGCCECPIAISYLDCLMEKKYVCPIGHTDDCPIIEVVPCKECKFSHMTYGGQCKYCDMTLDDDDNYIECYFDGDHFCGFGERRE